MVSSVPIVQLCIGPLEATRAFGLRYAQKIILECGGCERCIECRSIAEMRSSRLYWLRPAPQGYTSEQLAFGLAPLELTLAENERCCLVIESADGLTLTTANRLLKLLEEPPLGWHIILLAECRDLVLPTVRSRCIESFVSHEGGPSELGVLTWLENPEQGSFLEACSRLKELETTPLKTVADLNRLIAHWHRRWQERRDGRSRAILELLYDAQNELPAHGGSLAFWRVLMLRTERLLNIPEISV